jgi:hypothetical protein
MQTKAMHPLTAALLVFAILTAGLAIAAPAGALKVEGARIAMDVEPGKLYNSTIGISIGAGEPAGDYAVDVFGFGQNIADGTYSALEAAKDTSPYTARPFISVDMSKVHLEPGERAVVTATIRVPADAKDGGRYAIILVHPATSTSGQPAAFATAVSIPVLLTATGGALTETGEIAAVEPSSADPETPLTVTTTFRNTGNHHFYGAVHNVTITDPNVKVMAAVKSAPFDRALIPGQVVQFRATVAAGLPQGTYELIARMEDADGTLIAVKKISLQVGTAATSSAETAPRVTAPVAATTKAPGPGAILTSLALVAGAAIFSCLWREKAP